MNLPALPAGLAWSTHYNASDITLQIVAIALPVTMTYVKADKKDNGVQVGWGTATEVDVKNYEIERSADGIHFSKVGSVNAHGASPGNYSWYDATPANGGNYIVLRLSILIAGLCIPQQFY